MALADLDIAGEEVRCTPIRKVRDLIKEGVKKGYKNIIACGDDSIAQKVITSLATLRVKKAKDLCFSIIPLRSSKIAQILGIPSIDAAPEIISKRRIEKVDLGKLDDQYFLTSCSMGAGESPVKLGSFWSKLAFMTQSVRYPEIQLKFKEGFKVTVQPTKVGIFNILDYHKGKLSLKINSQVSITVSPQDGLLDVIIVSKLAKFNLLRYLTDIQQNNFEKIPGISLFRTKKVTISSSGPIPITLDRQKVEKKRLVCEVIPQKLNVIVGKERRF